MPRMRLSPKKLPLKTVALTFLRVRDSRDANLDSFEKNKNKIIKKIKLFF